MNNFDHLQILQSVFTYTTGVRPPMAPCLHLVRIDSLCAMCGMQMPSLDLKLVPISHDSDKILSTETAARRNQKSHNDKLFAEKKLILILDLDQTILHTNDRVSFCDFTFNLNNRIHYVKLRNNLDQFLEEISSLYEIHVYTMGTREYAKLICDYIDPNKVYFGDRIVTRSENFNELKKNIGRITTIKQNVVILDDRADVWDYDPNLILIKPFWYHGMVDLNDPARLRGEGGAEGQCPPSDGVESICQMANAFVPSDDHELLFIISTLKRLHEKFFKKYKRDKRITVKKILKLRFFKNIKISAMKNFHPFIKFAGVALDDRAPTYVIQDSYNAKKFKTLDLDFTWILECIYKRRMVDVKDYIISDYTELDDIIKELEGPCD